MRYAAAGILVYVLVDPDDATWHLLGLDRSQDVETDKGVFGQDIELPEPLASTVRTAAWHPYGRGRAAGSSR